MNSASMETSESPVSSPSCPLCRPESRTGLRFHKDGHRIWRYQVCWLLFVHSQPSRDELLGIYGGGETMGYLLQHGAAVTGIDISESFYAIYHKRFPHCEVVYGSILQPDLLRKLDTTAVA